MPKETLNVGVVVKKRRINHAWATHSWKPVGILPSVPQTPPWTLLAHETDGELFYAGSCDVTLYHGETAHYRDNLVSGRPSLWVALRRAGEGYELACVCIDPYEGEALAQDPDLLVEAVAMPPEVAARAHAFYAKFHVEEPFIKRKRKKADPDALSRPAVRIMGLEEGQ